MSIMTIEEAQTKLLELIESLASREAILLTHNAWPVAKLIGQNADLPCPVCGRGRGKLIVVSEDDDHLEGFEEFM